MGGSEECDHVQDARRTKVQGNSAFNKNRPSRASTKLYGYYFKEVCGKCGAKRIDAQIGLESTPEEYIADLSAVFHEFKRVLRDDGTMWAVLGDNYDNKQLLGIPWKVAEALKKEGWFLRRDIICHKLNPMRESVKDRPTTSHQYMFLLTKRPTYQYDYKVIQEPAIEKHLKRRKGSVWATSTNGYKEKHFATFSPKLIKLKTASWPDARRAG